MENLNEVPPTLNLAPTRELEEKNEKKMNLTEVGPAGAKVEEQVASPGKTYLKG
jgi:hypothetical protein